MKKKKKKIPMEESPIKKFHVKIASLTFGAHFTDGYVIGIISFGLLALGGVWDLTPFDLGLLGSSVLIGLFFGSFLLGWASDYIGRQKIFLFSFILITLASFLQFFAPNVWILFVFRFFIGFGLGGDYTVGQAMLAEFSPKKYRGSLLGSFNVFFTIGYVVSSLLGMFLLHAGVAWNWMLASSTIPALTVLLLRIGTPESPKYLMSQGEEEKAQEIVRDNLGDHVYIPHEEQTKKLGMKHLFGKKYIKRTIFNGTFYACIVLPYFSVFTFLPTILGYFDMEEGYTADIVLNLFLLFGAFLGTYLTIKLTRRGFLISSFVICFVSLALLGIIPKSFGILLIIVFVVFTIFISAINNLVGIYPAESFPTELRASGVGVATACSRIGSAVGTFFLPILITKLGLSPTMLILSGVLLLGTIVSIALAPETKGKKLA
ncbi:MFS transporter [Terrilactibacillus sp. BCM23-1]|uniref:MFS transporter n=1 Tax=Terrilactibacillus tamarindi TaxID=2599694 RepID=A0A6N8CQG2_9BACI|nr:MFS transporter [Terrilactibacillus tamarindi]MTT32384.1 MFS transporter [Terrilactibacillus tamarindi]